MNKNIRQVLLLSSIIILSSIVLFKNYFSINSSKEKIVIGILQTVSHASLDEARNGFVDRMRSTLGNNVDFIIQNAEGSIPLAQSIANSFHLNSKIDAIFAIATPALQVMHNIEKKKPIIISAVTDPNALGVVYKGSNVCGVSDMIDVNYFAENVCKLLHSLKKVALLFNPGESNSAQISKKLKNKFSLLGVETIEVGLNNVMDVPNAVSFACRNADAIISPTDNTVASAVHSISERAIGCNKPFIASFEAAIKEGALAAMGVNYYESGKAAADIAIEVLIKKISPASISIKNPPMQTIKVNKKVLEKLGISIPLEILNNVEFVN